MPADEKLTEIQAFAEQQGRAARFWSDNVLIVCTPESPAFANIQRVADMMEAQPGSPEAAEPAQPPA